MARNYAPTTDLTFSIYAVFIYAVFARRTALAVYVNLRRGKWLRSRDAFFVNTTEGLIVIAIKLCQEGNTEPLIQRTRRICLNRV